MGSDNPLICLDRHRLAAHGYQQLQTDQLFSDQYSQLPPCFGGPYCDDWSHFLLSRAGYRSPVPWACPLEPQTGPNLIGWLTPRNTSWRHPRPPRPHFQSRHCWGTWWGFLFYYISYWFQGLGRTPWPCAPRSGPETDRHFLPTAGWWWIPHLSDPGSKSLRRNGCNWSHYFCRNFGPLLRPRHVANSH